MAVRMRINVEGCEFEVWDKSIRFVSPFTSDMFHSPVSLDEEGARILATKLIRLINQGINFVHNRPPKLGF